MWPEALTRPDILAVANTIVDHEEVQTIVQRSKRKKCAYGQQKGKRSNER